LQTIALDKRSIGNTAEVAEKDLQRAVTSQYISAYGSMLTMQFNEEIQALLEKEERILKELTQSNIYKQADYLTFYVTLQQQRLIYQQSEIQYKNDFAMLNYLCGILDTAAVPLTDPALRPAGPQTPYNTIFYRQFSLDSLKVLNQRSVIGYSYKPKVSAFADAGYLSSLSYQAEKNFGASVGVTLTIPIYDGRQRRMKYSKTEITERTRTAYRDFFLRQYDQQVAQLLQQLGATQRLVNEIDGQIKYSRTLIEVNERLLETGNARITDYIVAINTYLNARNLSTGNYISRQQIINQINYWQAL
jgi:outer membrane protein TolC